MSPSTEEKVHSKEDKKSFFGRFLIKLRKRRIIETLVAFIGGGWLLVEVVEWLLVGHYKFPEETIDLTVVSVIGALLSTLIWQWFRSTETRSGNIRVEVLAGIRGEPRFVKLVELVKYEWEHFEE